MEKSSLDLRFQKENCSEIMLMKIKFYNLQIDFFFVLSFVWDYLKSFVLTLFLSNKKKKMCFFLTWFDNFEQPSENLLLHSSIFEMSLA